MATAAQIGAGHEGGAPGPVGPHAPGPAGRLVGGRYVLEALIGRGGMGEVWRARHTALNTRVAVKFLRGASEPSERARRRFLTEAQVTANLRTRHAVQVFDFGVTDEGLPYLVMELLEGETLDQRIARLGRLPLADTSLLLQKAARALERAHALGIVHRDFKPENVMLVADEEDGGELVKVVDFGIAKLIGDLDATIKNALGCLVQARRLPSAPVLEVTSGGVGTPYYMAPEQVQDSAQVGPAADIWAFGVVAYECLTGRRPFDDESIGKLLVRVLAAAPPVPASSLAPVPPAFDDWFRLACARDPAARFPDIQTAAAGLASALGTAALAGSPAPTPPALPAPNVPLGPVPDAAPTLSSRQDPPRAEALSPKPPEPAPLSPRSNVSPLAMTLEPSATPGHDGGDAPGSAGSRALRSVPLVPARVSPFASRLFHAFTALLALTAAVLATMLAVRDDPARRVGGLVTVAGVPPLEIATAVDDGGSAADLPLAIVEPRPEAPSLAPPTVTPQGPPPEPSASSAASSRPPHRPFQTPPSAYRLPPLGL
jgi:serine/threonine protein kinase